MARCRCGLGNVSRGDAGQFYVSITYSDWAGFASVQQAASADPEYRRLYGEALKIGELQDRSVIIAEEA